MTELLSEIVSWMESLQPATIYLAAFAISYVENVVPPIPGDMVIVFAGYLVGAGYIAFLPVLILTSLGGVLGFMTMYAVGQAVGAAVFDVDRMKWVPKEAAHRARRWILKYGMAVVVGNRFLSGARSVISLSVGAARLAAVPVMGWSALSALIWCSLLLGLGYIVGDQWEVVGTYLRIYGEAVLIGVILLLAAYFAMRYVRLRRRRHRRSGEDPAGGASRAEEH